ncbi:hypothetical protein D9615_009079 [Tricholomella constricta]|uniref:Protein kinase domain-containing protein n=1 Tax=Tricholomella constricta TaxID=117010 RepID=A0A8H5LYS9_9AGAR|nr:hypothetical protein D9615_009079 [Tricholomella constricta]
MERLGPSVAELKKEESAGVKWRLLFQGSWFRRSRRCSTSTRSLGIVHRDIKPENFLCALDDASTIKPIDFGISKPFSRGSTSGP